MQDFFFTRHTAADDTTDTALTQRRGHWSERSRRQPQAGRAEAGPHPGGPARQTNRDGCRRNVCAHVPRTGTRAAAADATRQWRRYGRRAIMHSWGLRGCTVSRQSARASCHPWCDLSIGRRLARALSLAQSMAQSPRARTQSRSVRGLVALLLVPPGEAIIRGSAVLVGVAEDHRPKGGPDQLEELPEEGAQRPDGDEGEADEVRRPARVLSDLCPAAGGRAMGATMRGNHGGGDGGRNVTGEAG